MAIPDPVSAIVAFLRSVTDVAVLAGNRIYGIELPEGEAALMPRTAVVLTPSGGGAGGAGGRSFVPIGYRRIDIRCYGAEMVQAAQLHWAVYEAMKQFSNLASAGVLLYSAVVESSAIATREQEGDWPLVLSVWGVTVSEQAVTIP